MINATIEKIAYKTALEYVTKYGLDTAVTQILQGALGHPFMPSPSELRIHINSIMLPLKEARARDIRAAKIYHEQCEEIKKRQENLNKCSKENRALLLQKWEKMRANI